ncbi:hypothetical protein ACSBR2_027685 [Camellia fascicularis]
MGPSLKVPFLLYHSSIVRIKSDNTFSKNCLCCYLSKKKMFVVFVRNMVRVDSGHTGANDYFGMGDLSNRLEKRDTSFFS